MNNKVVIVEAIRTPIGKLGGALRDIPAKTLGITVIQTLLKNTLVPPDTVQEVIFASARQAGQGPNIGRQVAIGAGIPPTVPAFTINKACGSSLKAIILGYQAITLGDAEVVIAGGVESMSQAPYLLMKGRYGYRLGHEELLDVNMKDGYFCPITDQLMGRTVENLVEEFRISREAQDQFAVTSHQKAVQAMKSGRFNEEITPIPGPKIGLEPISIDENPRTNTNLEQMAKLKPTFKPDGTITPGNSSAPTDGAAAVLMMNEETAKKNRLTPMATLSGYASVGVEPKRMGISPSSSLQTLFQKTSTSMENYDLLELNEAFAAQVLAVDKEIPLPFERMNVNGGAIALGHPTGCTGTRLVVTLLHEMIKRKSKRGAVTLCISGGLGLAVGFERIP